MIYEVFLNKGVAINWSVGVLEISIVLYNPKKLIKPLNQNKTLNFFRILWH